MITRNSPRVSLLLGGSVVVVVVVIQRRRDHYILRRLFERKRERRPLERERERERELRGAFSLKLGKYSLARDDDRTHALSIVPSSTMGLIFDLLFF